MQRPDLAVEPVSPASSRSPARDPLWPLVVCLAEIAERVERRRVAEFTATTAGAESVEIDQDEAA